MSLYADPLFVEAELAWRRQRDSVSGNRHLPPRRRRHRPHLLTWLGGHTNRPRRSIPSVPRLP